MKVALLSFAHTHAMSYATALQAMPGVELLTADPDGASAPDAGPRGAALAAELGVAYVDSYEEALAWRPDAVVIAAENARHRALVELAAAAGAHVLCEKPLATSVADAEAMIAATEAAGVALMVAYPVRFAPAFREQLALLRSGALGEILAIRGTNNGKLPIGERRWFTDPELAGGGALVDHVVHCADLIDELLGLRAESVRAVANGILYNDSGVQVETGGIVSIGYPNGVIASIDCSWSWPTASPTWGGLTLQVLAERGTVTISPFAAGVSGYELGGESWRPFGADFDALLLGEFLAAVRDGRAPRPGGDVGLRTLEVVAAAQRSARDGQPVRL